MKLEAEQKLRQQHESEALAHIQKQEDELAEKQKTITNQNTNITGLRVEIMKNEDGESQTLRVRVQPCFLRESS